MSEPVVPRERIAQQADEAARQTVRTGLLSTNPYPTGSAAAAAWKASYERFLLLHSASDGAEGSA